MSDMQIQSVLAEMRALSARAAGGTDSAAANAAQGTSFTQALKQSISEVNSAQQTASTMATRFEQGTPGVDLSDVMVSMQKASLQFEAVTQVRNRLVAAYREIMNMQA